VSAAASYSELVGSACRSEGEQMTSNKGNKEEDKAENKEEGKDGESSDLI
jgi:hypothetical protein